MTQITREEILAEFQSLTLMDDSYMRLFFTDNIPCVQLVLRIIMNKDDLIVKSAKVQQVMRSADTSRYVRLDVYAVDSENKHYDIEVQNDSLGASPQRARYNSAMIDANILKTGELYSLLKERESIVIFITDNDVLGDDEPIYMIERVITKNGKKFNDGTHIVYVNSSKQDTSTALGKLMHDFKCAKADDMFYAVLSDKARTLKGSVKGDDKNMSLLGRMEEEAELRGEARGKAIGETIGKAKGETKASENIALNLIKAGKLALDEIANVCSLTLQRVQELAKTAS
ncbi:MAG: PD-(D/E)XK nuclease family transposase [Synergistaceae bacterium]|nr:PD-(D/E)XK nuclease family transposase [Synergistaceae bacterium]MBQ3693184.1 PD-(D/E)XK nuclease family transposase [Synergistaceae bacterium]MBR0249909.1 PD-(D/E)XK nuclease family transposase [Synergistaceae bacterium]